MWKRMMHAGEVYLESAVQGRAPVPVARPGANRGRLARVDPLEFSGRKTGPEIGYLKYIHAATATKTTAKIQRDESLIPVFLAIFQSYPDGLLLER
jgi:hypothetical protein